MRKNGKKVALAALKCEAILSKHQSPQLYHLGGPARSLPMR
jgi:hypothetical protein